MFWAMEDRLETEHGQLMAFYKKFPDLRGLHRRWRVLGIAAERIEALVSSGEVGRSNAVNASERHREREAQRRREILTEISAAKSEVEGKMRACFKGRGEYRDFMDLSEKFYRSWVHKSHNPHNRKIGMSVGLHGVEGRREVFFVASANLVAGGSGRAAPRAFPAGAWIDEECLKAHRVKMEYQ